MALLGDGGHGDIVHLHRHIMGHPVYTPDSLSFVASAQASGHLPVAPPEPEYV